MSAACSSPAAPASSARTSSARCSSAATTCACSTTSPPAAARTSPTSRDDVEVVEGDLRSYERVHTAVRGRRDRLPPGRARLGAALRAGPAHVDRRQRRGDAQRPARGARRGRPACRRGLVVLRLRRRRDVPAGRDPGAEPDLAVRGREARRRALLRQLLPRLRDRDGGAALLQRLRAAPGPDLAVRRRRAAVRAGDRRTAARSRSTATASSRATSPTSRTSSRRTSLAAAAAEGGGRRAQHRGRRLRDGQHARRHDRRGCSTAGRASPRPAQPGRRARVVGRRHRCPRADRLRARGRVRGGPAADDRQPADTEGAR